MPHAIDATCFALLLLCRLQGPGSERSAWLVVRRRKIYVYSLCYSWTGRRCIGCVVGIHTELGESFRRATVRWFHVWVTQLTFDLRREFYKMALGSCYTCLKYLMFVFNFVFWVSIVSRCWPVGAPCSASSSPKWLVNVVRQWDCRSYIWHNTLRYNCKKAVQSQGNRAMLRDFVYTLRLLFTLVTLRCIVKLEPDYITKSQVAYYLPSTHPIPPGISDGLIPLAQIDASIASLPLRTSKTLGYISCFSGTVVGT